MKCRLETCDKDAITKGLCVNHYQQVHKTGKLVSQEGKGYAEERTCVACGETKKWEAFVMGMEKPSGECRKCYRARILDDGEEVKNAAFEKNWQELLDYVEKKAGRKRK